MQSNSGHTILVASPRSGTSALDQATDPQFLQQLPIHPFNGQAWENNIQTLRQEANVAKTDSANALQ
jgi:hypothetical protein